MYIMTESNSKSDPCNLIKQTAESEVDALSKLTNAIGTIGETEALTQYNDAKTMFENTYNDCENSKKQSKNGGKRKRTAKNRRSKKQKTRRRMTNSELHRPKRKMRQKYIKK